MKKVKTEIRLFAAAMLALCAGCSRPKVYQTADDQLALQIAKLGNDDDSVSTFKVRLRLLSPVLTELAKDNNEAMYYRADSCFYLSDGNRKVYPLMLQPIANGASYTYEYLISFPQKYAGHVPVNLTYQDHYFNRRTYSTPITD